MHAVYAFFSLALNGGGRIFSLPVLTLIFPALLPCLMRDSLCTALQTERIWIWLLESSPGEQCSETLLLPPPPYTDIAPPPTTRLRDSLWTASLSSGSDQCRISGCGNGWLLAGPDSLPRYVVYVLLCCWGLFPLLTLYSPRSIVWGLFFFSSLSSCYAVFFFNSTCISLLIILCMIVYVTNNKEPWTLVFSS